MHEIKIKTSTDLQNKITFKLTGLCRNNLFANILTLYIFLNFATFSLARVEIVEASVPFYVKSDESLVLTCESKQETEITWHANTAATGWIDSELVPGAGSDVIIKTCKEKPSGLTRSTLIKKNMTLNDRGHYICKDSHNNNYNVWVVVLYIKARNVTSLTDPDPIVLSCVISGFEANPPAIDYDWLYNGAFIPHDHSNVPEPVMHSSARIKSSTKYRVSFHEFDLRLEIYSPTSSDGGIYNCSFTFKTNIGKLTLMDQFYLNGTQLSIKTAGAEKSSKVGFSVISFIIVIVIPLIVDL